MTRDDEITNYIRDTSETDGELEQELWEHVDKKAYADAVQLIHKKRHKDYIYEHSMDLIPFLVMKLRDINCDDGIHCIEQLLDYIAKVSKFKEVFLALLGAIPCLDSTKHVIALLNPVKTCLLGIVTTNCNAKHFTDAFETITLYFRKIEMPIINNLVGKERMLLDSDPSVLSHFDLFSNICDFLKTFLDLASNEHLVFAPPADTKKVFVIAYLHLFDKLSLLDIYSEQADVTIPSFAEEEKQVKDENGFFRDTRKTVECMRILTVSNFISLFKYIRCTKGNTVPNDDDYGSDLSNISLGTFFYCVFCQGMELETSVPYVYDMKYQFFSLLPALCDLISENKDLPLHKGLLLCQYFMYRIDKCSLNANALARPFHHQFVKVLVKSMIMIENKELRVLALKIFHRHLSLFDDEGSYHLIEFLLKTEDHSGFAGLVVSEIKNNFMKFNNLKSKKLVSSKYGGSSLLSLIELACYLPDHEYTDMLDNNEKILAGLNLLIFFYTSARNAEINSNQPLFETSSLLEHMKHIKSNFFEPLYTGLNISREHYKLKIKDLDDKKASVESKMEISVNVKESLFPGSTPEEEKKFVNLALTRFDMLSHVLSQSENAHDKLREIVTKREHPV